jgi:hypothetical protein
LNIPPEQIKELAPQLLPNKDAEIITYCTSLHWNASEFAARVLVAMGYTSVAHPEGKQGWMEAGLPVEGCLGSFRRFVSFSEHVCAVGQTKVRASTLKRDQRIR